MGGIGRFFSKRMEIAFEAGVRFIAEGIKTYRSQEGGVPSSSLNVLDIGIGDGAIARKVRRYTSLHYQLTGIDVGKGDISSCDHYVCSNLESDLPFRDASFDLIYSNQVFEHLVLKSAFLSECKRVLKSEGRLLITTENIASLDNIVSLCLGQEPLVQHTSEKIHSNTFLSPHFMELYSEGDLCSKGVHLGHKNVSSFFGLRRLLEYEGMVVEQSFGAGHVAPWVDNWLKFQCRVIGFWARK